MDRQTISGWINQEAELRATAPGAFRVEGAGRHLTSLELEIELAGKILSVRHEKQRVTRTLIVHWARALATEYDVDMEFSQGWLEGFLNRHDFVLRRATSKPVLSDSVIVERGASFILHIKSLIREYNIAVENIYSFDETSLFFDHCKNTTIDVRGATHVPILSFASEKIRVTGLLAASAAGRKLPPTIFVREREEGIPIRNVSGTHWLAAQKSWMNQDLFIQWISFHFSFVSGNTVLLVFDSARSHISKKVKEFLHRRGLLFAVIPVV